MPGGGSGCSEGGAVGAPRNVCRVLPVSVLEMFPHVLGSSGGVGAAIHWAWHLGVEATGVGGHTTSVSDVLVVGLGDVHGLPVDLGLSAVLGVKMIGYRSYGHPQGAVGALFAAAKVVGVAVSHSGDTMGVGLI